MASESWKDTVGDVDAAYEARRKMESKTPPQGKLEVAVVRPVVQEPSIKVPSFVDSLEVEDLERMSGFLQRIEGPPRYEQVVSVFRDIHEAGLPVYEGYQEMSEGEIFGSFFALRGSVKRVLRDIYALNPQTDLDIQSR